MQSWFETALAPPVFEDDEQTRTARLLNTVLVAMAAVSLACGPIYTAVVPSLATALPFIGLFLASIATFAVARTGRTRLAARLIVGALFSGVTASILLFSDIAAPLYATYAICILLAGLLLGGRVALIVTAASIALGWGFAHAVEVGLWPSGARQPLTPAYWAAMNSYFAVVALLLVLADRNMRDTLASLRATREALEESDERYALATSGANDGLWDWNLRTNEIYYSPRWKEMLGLPAGERETSPSAWLCRLHADDRERVRAELDAHMRGATEHFESEHRVLHEDGTYRWVLTRGLAVRDDQGTPYRMAGSQSDITSRKMVEQQFEHAALHDALTGLPNRGLFLDRLDQAIMRGHRAGEVGYAVVFLDLDRFKVINDSLGHLMGNELLVAFARRLEGCLRPTDTAARLGGDEFAILVEGMDHPADVDGVIERIQQRMAEAFVLDGREVHITASMGVAPGAQAYGSADDVLRDADIAMYRAKALGKDRCEEFAPDMHSQAVALLELETDLRRALEVGELSVVYQPSIDAHTGCVRGFEALVRWFHPTRGTISPAEFIPMAEDTGLVVEVDRAVLRSACRQLAEWRESAHGRPDLYVAVNLSSLQFARADLVPQIVRVLDENGLPPSALCIEITESALMTNTACTSDNLKMLRDLGIHLAVDDFGTGYSSLGYLHRYPVDTLKIDRSFVRNVERDPDKETIVRTIIAMADSLDLRVVAEGVETVGQLAALRRMKCTLVQGFLFSRPVDEVTATRYLDEGLPWSPEDALSVA